MDVQIGHEKTLTGLMPVLAGTDLIYGLGMIDMGMAVSFEQFIMDAEFVRMFKRTEKPVEVDEDALALDVIKAVGSAGNFLSQRHTLKHMRGEISDARLIDLRMRESWEKDGAKDMTQRAREEALRILAEHRRTMEIFSETGIWVKSPVAFDALKKAGARTDDDKKIVYFTEEMVQKALDAAPKSFTLGARNPKYDYRVPSTESRHLMSGICTNIYNIFRCGALFL